MEVTDCVSVIKIITHCYCFTLVNLFFLQKYSFSSYPQ